MHSKCTHVSGSFKREISRRRFLSSNFDKYHGGCVSIVEILLKEVVFHAKNAYLNTKMQISELWIRFLMFSGENIFVILAQTGVDFLYKLFTYSHRRRDKYIKKVRKPCKNNNKIKYNV